MTKAVTKTNSRKPCKDDYVWFLRSVSTLAGDMQCLVERAMKEYSPVVENIMCTKCRDARYIEQTLDGLLNFCFDPNVLALYKKLCRYYYTIDHLTAISYVNVYREMWNSESAMEGHG